MPVGGCWKMPGCGCWGVAVGEENGRIRGVDDDMAIDRRGGWWVKDPRQGSIVATGNPIPGEACA
ncbi:MAG: hypothetical protein M0Z63_12760 [Actinomycetota bacterium]|jgi:hypothetical protein|nr:hypothetical protein [Actinomycetota bacterium]